MLWRRKGVETESQPPWHYSPGRKRKKNAIQYRYMIAYCIGVTPCVVASRQCKIAMGMGRTRVGGGIFSCIVLKLSSQPKVEASHGVESWICGPHCHVDFPQESEVLLNSSFLNGESVGGKDSCSYPFKKTWINRTGSLTPARSSGTHSHVQNDSHLCQVFESLRNV